MVAPRANGPAAASLAGLIVSLSGGGMPDPPVLDALSVGTAAGALVVMMMAYAGVGASGWGQAGRALALSGMTLVLVGDGLQAVATRTGFRQRAAVVDVVRDPRRQSATASSSPA